MTKNPFEHNPPGHNPIGQIPLKTKVIKFPRTISLKTFGDYLLLVTFSFSDF